MNPRSFSPARTRRASEEICAQIRQEIAAGSLRPGDKLPAERELAREFGVSRTAVREALRMLETAGVVQLQKGGRGGALIMEAGPGGITQSIADMVALGRISLKSLTEARVLLCDNVVRLACKRATSADLAAIEANILFAEELFEKGENPREAEEWLGFYHVLAAAAHNEILTYLVIALTNIMRELIARIAPRPQSGVLESRRRLLAYLRARDVERATAEISAHLTRVHRHMLQQDRLGRGRPSGRCA